MLKSFENIKPDTKEEQELIDHVKAAKECLDKLVDLKMIRIGTQRRACHELNSALAVVGRDLGRPFHRNRNNKDERAAQIQAAVILKEKNIKDNETKLEILNAERENVEKENCD